MKLCYEPKDNRGIETQTLTEKQGDSFTNDFP